MSWPGVMSCQAWWDGLRRCFGGWWSWRILCLLGRGRLLGIGNLFCDGLFIGICLGGNHPSSRIVLYYVMAVFCVSRGKIVVFFFLAGWRGCYSPCPLQPVS